MITFATEYYIWFKALHIISMVAWMAGMLYLPRLYVYHAGADKGSELSQTFKVMERKLLRLILNPAMILTAVFGIAMLVANPILLAGGWMHVKLTAVVLLFVFHGFLARWRKIFLKDLNERPPSFYRRVNEIPAILMVVIVVMVIVQPF